MTASDITFYGDWLFYGGICGTLAFGLVIFKIGKKSGHENINWKHYLIYGLPIFIPSVILPIIFLPIPIWHRAAGVQIILFTAICHYYFVTRMQNKIYVRYLKNNKNQVT